MHKYKDLKVWQKALELTKLIYEITRTFPTDEKFGLTNQIRRASVSVPSNIAEGAGRNSDKEFIQFLAIATGSCYEVETQLIIAIELKYIAEAEEVFKLTEEIQKMLFAFSNKLKQKNIA
jgi:four helix bundle protein